MLDESGLSIEGAVAAGLVAAIDARPLKQIAGKRKGGEIGGESKPCATRLPKPHIQ